MTKQTPRLAKSLKFPTAYNFFNVKLHFLTYTNGNKAIKAVHARTGESIMTCSVNPPGEILAPNEIAIKTWRENHGCAEALIEAGVISGFVTRRIPSGFVEIPIYGLTSEALKMWEDA